MQYLHLQVVSPPLIDIAKCILPVSGGCPYHLRLLKAAGKRLLKQSAQAASLILSGLLCDLVGNILVRGSWMPRYGEVWEKEYPYVFKGLSWFKIVPGLSAEGGSSSSSLTDAQRAAVSAELVRYNQVEFYAYSFLSDIGLVGETALAGAAALPGKVRELDVKTALTEKLSAIPTSREALTAKFPSLPSFGSLTGGAKAEDSDSVKGA